jgi:hypothetical protein
MFEVTDPEKKSDTMTGRKVGSEAMEAKVVLARDEAPQHR